MLLLPYSTDAPIYHWPISTASIIAVNVAMYFATVFQLNHDAIDYQSVEWLILSFETVNPLQWLTYAFMHSGIVHLLGNMLFLWTFGLVVEGKLGSIKFAALYVAMAVIVGAILQIPSVALIGTGGGLGASGVIYSLMVIALLWAPDNEVECFYWFLRPGTIEFRIFSLGMFYIALQILFLFFNGFSMSGEMGHMAGVMVGLPFGYYLMHRGIVDCEGWDLVSRNAWLRDIPLLTKGRHMDHARRKQQSERDDLDPVAAAIAVAGSGGSAIPTTADAMRAIGNYRIDDDPRLPGATATTPGSIQTRHHSASATPRLLGRKRKRSGPASVVDTESPIDAARRHPEFNRLAHLLRTAIGEKQAMMAHQHYAAMRQRRIDVGLADETLVAYVKLLAAQNEHRATIPPLDHIARRGGPMANQARLKLAEIQLRVLNQPELALQTLATIEVPADATSPSQRRIIARRDAISKACRSV